MTERSGLGLNAPVGIPPRNKKALAWPPISVRELRQEPWAQFRPRRNRPQGAPLSRLRATDLVGVYPAREGANYKERLPTSGAYWSSTMSDLVFYESRLERETIMSADFDPDVVEIVSQPFRLRAVVDGKCRLHTPDYALLRSDGSIEVINCKPFAHLLKPKVVELHAWVGNILGQAGIVHRVASELPPERLANLVSIAHMRNPRWLEGLPMDVVAAVCANPAPIRDVLAALDGHVPAPVVLVCIRALLWHRVLETDLDRLLSRDSIVGPRHA